MVLSARVNFKHHQICFLFLLCLNPCLDHDKFRHDLRKGLVERLSQTQICFHHVCKYFKPFKILFFWVYQVMECSNQTSR
ncbi:CLUMA_CG013582, isoform A [Clunio marinus]|uniref:CLUMA_CG013582, isoform A n=1 Tax=Clunio marinus TaxID=568069 RepID=A0A1J1IJ93_9DIPT|nr:CLUMA_CG013582, isoform A [Clunio marinus]